MAPAWLLADNTDTRESGLEAAVRIGVRIPDGVKGLLTLDSGMDEAEGVSFRRDGARLICGETRAEREAMEDLRCSSASASTWPRMLAGCVLAVSIVV